MDTTRVASVAVLVAVDVLTLMLILVDMLVTVVVPEPIVDGVCARTIPEPKTTMGSRNARSIAAGEAMTLVIFANMLKPRPVER